MVCLLDPGLTERTKCPASNLWGMAFREPWVSGIYSAGTEPKTARLWQARSESNQFSCDSIVSERHTMHSTLRVDQRDGSPPKFIALPFLLNTGGDNWIGSVSTQTLLANGGGLGEQTLSDDSRPLVHVHSTLGPQCRVTTIPSSYHYVDSPSDIRNNLAGGHCASLPLTCSVMAQAADKYGIPFDDAVEVVRADYADFSFEAIASEYRLNSHAVCGGKFPPSLDCTPPLYNSSTMAPSARKHPYRPWQFDFPCTAVVVVILLFLLALYLFRDACQRHTMAQRPREPVQSGRELRRRLWPVPSTESRSASASADRRRRPCK